MISKQKMKKVVDLLLQASHPKKIILFGSYARGNERPDSDLDLLVVEKKTENRAAEMVRLRRVLSPLRILVDLIVVGEAAFEEWSDTPGNLMYEVSSEGKVLYEAARTSQLG